MIRLFTDTETAFTSWGDAFVKPYMAEITREDNGEYRIYLETDLSYVDSIVAGKLLAVDTPEGTVQAFRVRNTEKTKRRLKIDAMHVMFDADNYIIKDSYVVQKTANQALNHLNDATDKTSPFTVSSDITTVKSYRCVRKSLYEAWQVVVERWGGHLIADNWDVSLLSEIGRDRGVTIRYAANLADINVVDDWNDVCTKLMPVGYDGLLLPETYIVSDVQYDVPYTKVVSFTQDVAEEDYESTAAYIQALTDDLRAQAEAYIEIHKYPQTTYTVSAHLDDITTIGDTIEVQDERLGVNMITHVIGYTWDVLSERFTQIVFGTFLPKLSDIRSKISAQTQKQIAESEAITRSWFSEELQEATDIIKSGMTDSYVIYDGSEIYVLDSLPKETATNVIRINKNGIGFSNSGIDNPSYSSVWDINGNLYMQNMNVLNLTADMIQGGILTLGGTLYQQGGVLQIRNADNDIIGQMDENGLRMNGTDGSYVLINNNVGFSGYDSEDNRIFWADGNSFHMAKAEVTEEITMMDIGRWIRITVKSGGTVTNDGVGLVSV